VPEGALHYWPWWAGAAGLAAAALSHLFLLRKPMGVSGAYARVLSLKRELSLEREERRAFADQGLRRAMILETAAEMRAGGVPEVEVAALEAEALRAQAALLPSNTPVTAQAVFLVYVALGALASAALNGRLGLQLLPQGLHPAFFGRGLGLFAALFGGGLLVGAGTRLAGGCTSGHGLSGCARLAPASFVATALFFGMGVGVSLLLARVLS
jgi:uncharacterized membrane protein YedE/YeeE